MPKTDKASRIVEAYSKLQALGGRVKPSPFQYANSAALRLEKRASAAIDLAERELLYRANKKLAYQLLKAKGEKVRPNVNDYSNGTSVIRRAKAIAAKDVLSNATTFDFNKSQTFRTSDGKTGRFDTYVTRSRIEMTGEQALDVAGRIIAAKGSQYDKAQIILGGLLIPYFDHGEEKQYISISYVSGPQSKPPSAAIGGYRPYEKRFEYVIEVKVIFKTVLI